MIFRSMYSLKNIAIVLSVGLLATACGSKNPNDPGIEYAPAMYHSRAYEPLTQVTDDKSDYYNSNSNNPYKMNMREPVKNTVKVRSYTANYSSNPNSELYIYHLSKDSSGVALANKLSNPIQKSDAVIEEGKVLYGRYCQHCHGEGGKGDGPVGLVFKGVPNYAGLKDRTEGSIFHTITFGKNRMMAHGSQVSVPNRWKIVHYVQTLQNQ